MGTDCVPLEITQSLVPGSILLLHNEVCFMLQSSPNLPRFSSGSLQSVQKYLPDGSFVNCSHFPEDGFMAADG